jgi:hypothetical protein
MAALSSVGRLSLTCVSSCWQNGQRIEFEALSGWARAAPSPRTLFKPKFSAFYKTLGEV